MRIAIDIGRLHFFDHHHGDVWGYDGRDRWGAWYEEWALGRSWIIRIAGKTFELSWDAKGQR